MKANTKEIYLPDIVGGSYGEYWNYKGRYRVVKGSRASKKSTTTAMNLIYRIMEYPKSNGLVIRKVYRTMKDSCFAQLKWAIDRLGVIHLWKETLNPLELIYIPTGQKILFRGLDDPLKLASTTVDNGHLAFIWIEEAYEIMNEDDFNMIDESIRGQVPNGLFKQITLTLNPWNEKHWIKRRFFDTEDENILAITTDYKCNEWLDESDKKVFENMRLRNPKRYKVAGLGDWGIVEGLIYENWREMAFILDDLPKDTVSAFGLDYGYTNDPSAFVAQFYSPSERRLYVWDEFYEKRLSNRKIFDRITEMGYGKEKIIADSAEPKSNDELREYGLRVNGAKKGKDSVQNGIQWLQDVEIRIHPRCVNFLTEISNYGFKVDRFGKTTNEPADNFNHLMDAMRYGVEAWRTGRIQVNLHRHSF